VMDEHYGSFDPALQVAEVRQELRDLGRVVLVSCDQVHYVTWRRKSLRRPGDAPHHGHI